MKLKPGLIFFSFLNYHLDFSLPLHNMSNGLTDPVHVFSSRYDWLVQNRQIIMLIKTTERRTGSVGGNRERYEWYGGFQIKNTWIRFFLLFTEV